MISLRQRLTEYLGTSKVGSILERSNEVVLSTISKNIGPPPKLKVSEWSDKYRRLSSESSSATGGWYTSQAEYQRGIMDAVNDPFVEEVVIMTSSQVGKSEILNNIIGYYSHQDPSPILMIQPTLEMSEAYSKDRITPMVRDTDVLKGIYADPKSKSSGSTMLHKKFLGGHLTLAGSNSPASLASRPIRIVLFDEVDRFPQSAGSEGDPVDLARKRTRTFWNRKIIMASTPTVRDMSRIEAAYQESDQRKYFVPCPDCAHMQTLKWKNVKWKNSDPKTAVHVCENCESSWGPGQIKIAVRNGKWIGSKEKSKIAGFWLWELYSPWSNLESIVESFLKAKKHKDQLQVFVNTTLAETWDSAESDSQIDSKVLFRNKEPYDSSNLPEAVLIVTCGVDVQGDRLEMEVTGWGAGEESWSIEYNVLRGNPSSDQIWNELAIYLNSEFKTVDGRILKISATCIDSGGHNTDDVYKFVYMQGAYLRVFAIKGLSTQGRSIVPFKPSKVGRPKINLFMLGVDTAKQLIYSRLSLTEPGPGYSHFPERYGEEYFSMLTAEKLVRKYVSGKMKLVWQKKPSERNEALDCRVYSIAALKLIKPNFDLLKKEIERVKLKIPTTINSSQEVKVNNSFLM